jgi:excisionase family DNA binding protein
MEEKKLTMNVNEASKALGVSRPSLYKAIRNNEVPVIRLGHRVLIPVAALDKYLENAGNHT